MWSKEKFLEVLDHIGWSQAELSRRLGVHVNTVSAWATGKVAVPKYAQAFMRITGALKEILK